MTNSGVASRRAVDLAEVVAALPDPVLLMSATGELVWGNGAAERLFGVALADGIGRNMLEFLHPDNAEMALVSAAAMQRKAIGTLLELRIRGFDGWRLVEVRGASFHDDILMTLRDITDRRRWEVASNNGALFQAVFQNSTSITMVLEADGSIRSTSAVVTRLLGHDQELLEGQPLARIVDDRDRVSLETVLQDATARRSAPVTVDLRLIHRDRSVVPFALTFTNVIEDPTLAGIVVTGHDVSDRVAAEDALRESNSMLFHQTLHDPLTKLANQILLRDRIDQAVARLNRSAPHLAVLFIDLDDFKNVNDTLGHWAGDALLVHVSSRLTQELRAVDTVARLGGDEFAVLVEQLTRTDEAADLAQRILDALQEPVTIATARLRPTASIGIAYGNAGTNTDELLRNADLAMYAAKSHGKNCCRVFTADMHESALRRLESNAGR